MPSLIPGYKYDIFISYRQKDNKGETWVSKFVEALKTELESTFKEDISVYFDENPHDRLQETHNVDKSLEGKLKCLIFIPILSQTYCDPNSYAWQYEFKAFLRMAENDRFGKDVRLRSGNVAGRILPIRIHDLEPEDIKLFEKETGGVLRALDFVFKTPTGVNRPLTPSDDPDKNLNKSLYRDQINKVAHAIKEIVSGLKSEPSELAKEKIKRQEPLEEIKKEEKKEVQTKPAKTSKRRLLPGIGIITVLIVAVIIAYPKIFKRSTLERWKASGERISVVVMPFQNLTNDTIWNIYQLGIQENLINYLSNFPKELLVKQTELITGLLQNKGVTNYASLTSSVAKTISQRLESNVFITGSIQHSGNKLRINAKLTDTKTDEVIKPFEVNGLYKEELILDLIDSLRKKVTDFLIVSKLEKDFEVTYLPSIYTEGITNSPEAYRNYIYGCTAYTKLEMQNAVRYLSQSVRIDSNFFIAKIMLCAAYEGTREYEKAKALGRKLYKQKDQMPIMQQNIINSWYAHFFQTPYDEIKYIRQLLEYDNQNPTYSWMIGNRYFHLNQYDKAIPEYKTSLYIYKKLGTKPMWYLNYSELGISYHKMGQYNEEKELYKRSEEDFPDNSIIIRAQAILAFTVGDTVEAQDYIEKYLSLRREGSANEAVKITSLASIYSEANILDKAEEFYRKAIFLDPESRVRYASLAYFLIDKERNINEGLRIADSLLKLSPESFNYMDTKGWGLYKQGKYNEALDILNKSWDLRMENTMFNETASLSYFHLEAAKKAVSEQKSERENR